MKSSYYEKIGEKVENIDAEIPFDLPEDWEFVRLKEIGNLSLDVIYLHQNIMLMK